MITEIRLREAPPEPVSPTELSSYFDGRQEEGGAFVRIHLTSEFTTPVMEDLSQFEAELKEQRAPSEDRVFPLRMIL